MFIELTNITKYYGEGESAFKALKGVNLNINQGDFLALMGPSGSGKSTMANILGCLDVASSGKYLFDGVDVFALNRNERALLRRFYIGFIFQGFNLLPRTTALENVELPLLYRGIKKQERKKMALEALEMVGLNGWETHTSNKLSGGQQQRVAIARAIASKPLFLLADEPTGNLDTKRSLEIMNILKWLNTDLKITILMVTHEAEMAKFAHREVHFLDGNIDPRYLANATAGANYRGDSALYADSTSKMDTAINDKDSALSKNVTTTIDSKDSTLDSAFKVDSAESAKSTPTYTAKESK